MSGAIRVPRVPREPKPTRRELISAILQGAGGAYVSEGMIVDQLSAGGHYTTPHSVRMVLSEMREAEIQAKAKTGFGMWRWKR